MMQRSGALKADAGPPLTIEDGQVAPRIGHGQILTEWIQSQGRHGVRHGVLPARVKVRRQPPYFSLRADGHVSRTIIRTSGRHKLAGRVHLSLALSRLVEQ